MAERLAWGKFSWADWETDDELALCSMAAQGFWLRLLCIASKNKGFVLVNGVPPTFGILGKRIGVSAADAKKWFDELKANGVLKVVSTGKLKGAIVSQRMVRAHKNSENGKLGGSPKHRTHNDNPVSLKADKNQSQKREDSPQPPGGPGVQLDLEEPSVQEAFDLWNATAKRCDLPVAEELTEVRRRAIRKRLAKHGAGGWRRALEAVGVSALCLGQKPGGWRADLDFVCQPSSFLRLLEGSYGADGKPPNVTLIEGWSPWPGRMMRFRAGGYWEEVNWGPRPGAAGCLVPSEYLDPASPSGNVALEA